MTDIVHDASGEPVWESIPVHRKWWFVALWTFLIIPFGLFMMWNGDIYWRRKGVVQLVPQKQKTMTTIAFLIIWIGGIARSF